MDCDGIATGDLLGAAVGRDAGWGWRRPEEWRHPAGAGRRLSAHLDPSRGRAGRSPPTDRQLEARSVSGAGPGRHRRTGSGALGQATTGVLLIAAGVVALAAADLRVERRRRYRHLRR